MILVTIGPGDASFEKFGHNAIWIHDPAADPTEVLYNYGVFDLYESHFIWHFIQGLMEYRIERVDEVYGFLNFYASQDRTIRLQQLSLNAQQRDSLRRFLAWNTLPENQKYRYNYFTNNCSTKVRDAIDGVIDHQVQLQTSVLESGTTFRWHTRRLTAEGLPLYAALDYMMGHPIDRPISVWEEMFLPVRMSNHLREILVKDDSGKTEPLVRWEKEIYASKTHGELAEPPSRFGIFLIVGLTIGGLLALGGCLQAMTGGWRDPRKSGDLSRRPGVGNPRRIRRGSFDIWLVPHRPFRREIQRKPDAAESDHAAPDRACADGDLQPPAGSNLGVLSCRRGSRPVDSWIHPSDSAELESTQRGNHRAGLAGARGARVGNVSNLPESQAGRSNTLMKHTYTFHLIGNAHLDPVWLWDWREGLSEGLVTCRTILDLMDQNKDLTFIRGEAAIYQHIEQNDPQTFSRIKKYVKAGRWDVVGGTLIQPDTNLPMTETFARHFAHGLNYFASRFGKRVRVGWSADSFGHAAGLPEILNAAGIESYAFSRPAPNIVPIAKPAFWWEGPGKSRVLCYRPNIGWYGSEREEMTKRLDALLEDSGKLDLHNVGVFYGLGNHGGGPTRRMLDEIATWQKNHPEVNVVFSGLHRLFDALRKEMNKKGGEGFFPTHRGELNFVLRGCYASLAKFKFQYRKSEALASSAEKTDAIIGSALSNTGKSVVQARHGQVARAAKMHQVWESVLFNSFHDILPGSSIERAFDEQIAWLGGAQHDSRAIQFEALTALSHQIDTRVSTPSGDMPSGVAMLVWNPHPRAFSGPIELEASLDYRPIWKYHKNVDALPLKVSGPDGQPAAFQIIDTEHHSMVELAWRKRVVMPVDLPAMGWNVIEMAWVEGFKPPTVEGPTTAPMPGVIDNGIYRVQARVGDKGIQINRNGRPIFNGNGDGLTAITVEDPWGSWGGMAEEPASLDLSAIRHQWRISEVQNLESGPIRSKMWVRLDAGKSRLELTISVSRGRDAVDVSARVLWDERSARLKLVMPVGDQAEFDVPAASVTRGPNGEVPGGRWVRVTGSNGSTFGFASDALYNFDTKDGLFRATVCRASRYADDVHTNAPERPWQPAVDAGELRFNFLISPGDEKLPALAEQLEQPPVAILVPPHAGASGGNWKRSGSLASIGPDNLKMLALKPAEDGKGLILRVQETSGKATQPQLKIGGKTVRLSRVGGHRIATWRLTGKPGAMKAKETNIAEE